MNFRACLVIPNFNHGYALSEILQRVERYALTTIVVNDASTDNTQQIIEDLQRRYPWLHAIHRPVNGGKGAAIRDGFDYATTHGYSHAVCIDGDGQHDPDAIARFLEEARRSPEALIIGAPMFGPEAPLIRRVGREFSNVCVALATWSFLVRDTLCGFRVYPLNQEVR